MLASMSRIPSISCSSAEAISWFRISSPSRSRPNKLSPSWANAPSFEKLKKPLVPLIVWIVRKMLSSRLRVVRMLLERDQVPVQLVKVLVAFLEELADKLFVFAHGAPRRQAAWK